MPQYDPQRSRSRQRKADDEGPAPVDALLGPGLSAPRPPTESPVVPPTAERPITGSERNGVGALDATVAAPPPMQPGGALAAPARRSASKPIALLAAIAASLVVVWWLRRRRQPPAAD